MRTSRNSNSRMIGSIIIKEEISIAVIIKMVWKWRIRRRRWRKITLKQIITDMIMILMMMMLLTVSARTLFSKQTKINNALCVNHRKSHIQHTDHICPSRRIEMTLMCHKANAVMIWQTIRIQWSRLNTNHINAVISIILIVIIKIIVHVNFVWLKRDQSQVICLHLIDKAQIHKGKTMEDQERTTANNNSIINSNNISRTEKTVMTRLMISY